MMLRSLLVRIWNRLHVRSHYSILIVPSARHAPRSLGFSGALLTGITYTLGAALIVAGVFAYQHARDYQRLRQVSGPILTQNDNLLRENAYLKKEQRQLQGQIESLVRRSEQERQDQAQALAEVFRQLEMLKKFATDLRVMAGFKLSVEKARRLGPDQGGPELPLSEYYAALFKLSGQELLAALAERRRALTGEMADQRATLRQLWNELEKQKSVLAGSPLGWPLEGRVTSTYGPRNGDFHPGLDVAVPEGTPVQVTAEGVVVFVGYSPGYGRMVEVEHGEGYSTVYGHLSRYRVAVGDRLVRSDLIGLSGNSGRTTGAHLHYEVRINGVPVDPANYLRPRGEPRSAPPN